MQLLLLQQVHKAGITKESGIQSGGGEEAYSSMEIRLEYKLKNGKTVNRFYTVQPRSEAGEILKDFFTRTECVMGMSEEQLLQAAPYLHSFYTQGREGKEMDIEGLDIDGLLTAVVADCRAGNMAQPSGYHYPVNYDLLGYKNIDGVAAYLEFGWDREMLERDLQSDVRYSPYLRYMNLKVYASCENTIEWMQNNGLLTEEAVADIYDGAAFMWG